jgi:hypothetical protein
VRRRLPQALLIAVLVLTGIEVRPAPVQAATVPAYDHVFVVVMENKAYGSIVGSTAAPYFNSMLGSGALATSYYAVTHPSLPNYLALVGGSTFGIGSDCTTCWISAVNIADRIEAAHKSWKAYEESMPSACLIGDSYPYAQKHNPLVYFNDVRTNTTRCRSHIVPITQMKTDLALASTTPSFGFITPNMCSDTHDCSVATGDSWLKAHLPAILTSPAFRTQRSLLMVTWDEDDFSGANHIPLLMLGTAVRSGYRGTTAYTHFSLLHTIEAALGVPAITANDANAALMADMFGPSGPPCTAARVSPAWGSARVGTTVTFTMTATGCPNPIFEVWLRDTQLRWHLMRRWGLGRWAWGTTGWAKGAYRLSFWANQSGSYLGKQQAYVGASLTLT